MKIQIILIILINILFIGCATKNATPKRVTNKIKITNENKYSSLEKDLIKISKENRRMNNEYLALLTSMKKHTKFYDKNMIPKGLSRRMTFHYEGPALVLLKTIAEETNYNFDYNTYRTYDSKNIVRYYKDTMLIDIIEDIADQLSYNIVIDQADQRISLQEY